MRDDSDQPKTNQRRDELLRRALATPPISNEEIERRSKEQGRRNPKATAAPR